MTGVRLEGTGAYTGITANQWFTVKTKGALDSTITWMFRSDDTIYTRVTLAVDYRVPLSSLNWLPNFTVAKMNEQEADLVLANLRIKFETSPQQS